ncbi:MAG: Hsp20 family protein [Blastocatellia bacterium]
MQTTKTRETTTKSAAPSPVFVETEKLFEHMKESAQAIAQRAFAFFEERGRELGHELEDWLRAEFELTRPVPVEIRETPEQMVVRAEVPGFSAAEISLSVEPRQVILGGKREPRGMVENEKAVFSELRPEQFCRTLALPAETDPARAAATLKDGVLALTLPRVTPAGAVDIDIKTT